MGHGSNHAGTRITRAFAQTNREIENMPRLFPAVVLGLVALTAAAPAQADWFHRTWHNIKRDFHRNNSWPEPFAKIDRANTKAPFALMVANGWRAQNTLTTYHFDRETGKLNEAGALKIEAILTTAPEEYRTVFVLRSPDNEITAVRVDSATEVAAKFAGESGLPQVEVTNVAPRGTPAGNIQAIGQKFEDSAPEPRLAAPTDEEN
jgi:hypothetical protein